MVILLLRITTNKFHVSNELFTEHSILQLHNTYDCLLFEVPKGFNDCLIFEVTARALV